jgi:DNA-3-methyladenine glycosylase
MVKKYSENGMNLKIRYFTDMERGGKLLKDFYIRDVLIVAPELIGKYIVIRYKDNNFQKFIITETEAYRGSEDTACHASRGETRRNKVMFDEGGKIYVYFVYGMYWMLNFVTAPAGIPQAALIRGIEGFNGPGKLTKALGIDRSYYGEDLTTSDRIWVEDNGVKPSYKAGPRIGIDYAGEFWKNKPWRYYSE